MSSCHLVLYHYLAQSTDANEENPEHCPPATSYVFTVHAKVGVPLSTLDALLYSSRGKVKPICFLQHLQARSIGAGGGHPERGKNLFEIGHFSRFTTLAFMSVVPDGSLCLSSRS